MGPVRICGLLTGVIAALLVVTAWAHSGSNARAPSPLPGNAAGYHRLVQCLRSSGAAILEADPELDAGGAGSVHARLGGTTLWVTLDPSVRNAHRTEKAVAILRGGSWVPGVALGRLLMRSHIAVVAYETLPNDDVVTRVEGCLGAPAALDPDIPRDAGSDELDEIADEIVDQVVDDG